MPELTFTKLKRKQTGELEKIHEEMFMKSSGFDENVILEELKADIKKEAEADNDSDPELVDILEVLSHTATDANKKEMNTNIKKEPVTDDNLREGTSKPCTSMYVCK